VFKRIDHVEIVTDQLDRTVQFYTEVLGFTVKPETGSSARV
jgi:catechol 2,3-dioxygenase-like lactoylglutathione lyase family enzyme